MILGKHALVTGGGTGVGRAIALALAEAGVSVTICGRRKAKLEAVAGENARIFPIAADVTDEAAMAGLYAEAEELRGPFDIVVANAGGAESSPAHKTSLADWQRALDLNLTGSFLTVKPALAGMAKRKAGRIVFVASTAGLKGYAYVAPYVAAKHGVVGLMRALATETVKSGVTVNA
ncbi:MAG TPA: SDR family NAD(P)-dependent oxidoreductase, partial [Dongiaceae bacterium]|nr:SDR family NAD(P)-dependent oxidoreductase [Dongiaceae bacterium]